MISNPPSTTSIVWLALAAASTAFAYFVVRLIRHRRFYRVHDLVRPSACTMRSLDF